MLKRLMQWFTGKDAKTRELPKPAANGQRAATMIAEAKPTIRTAGPLASPASNAFQSTQSAPAATRAEGAAVMTNAATTTTKGTGVATRKPEQHEISLRAHQIWLERGGEATENWLLAERELAERFSRR